MARRASHTDVTSKFGPTEFSPLRCIQATVIVNNSRLKPLLRDLGEPLTLPQNERIKEKNTLTPAKPGLCSGHSANESFQPVAILLLTK